jgi:hypothetical protein
MKLPGIESADVSLATATADIRLTPDNRITLPQLREVLKKNGYPTRDAQVSARGRVMNRGGTRVLDLLNGSTIELANTPAAARLPTNEIVDVAGTSRAAPKASELLTIKAEEVK